MNAAKRPCDPVSLSRSRQLRRDATDAERKLWSALRDRKLAGAKFRRQVPIGKYIVDLCCRENHLVIELDGGQHLDRAACDAHRT
jgi:very-short-patch-repair endonuclease